MPERSTKYHATGFFLSDEELEKNILSKDPENTYLMMFWYVRRASAKIVFSNSGFSISHPKSPSMLCSIYRVTRGKKYARYVYYIESTVNRILVCISLHIKVEIWGIKIGHGKWNTL